MIVAIDRPHHMLVHSRAALCTAIRAFDPFQSLTARTDWGGHYCSVDHSLAEVDRELRNHERNRLHAAQFAKSLE